MNAKQWIAALDLKPHPEGGFFRESYRSAETIPAAALPPRFNGSRAFSTAIYFLLEHPQFSAFHRIASDEIWHFYAGGTLCLHVITPQGADAAVRMGCNPGSGEVVQAVVEAGCWFAAELEKPDTFALVGCTVAPGFDFADFQMAARSDLCRLFPMHRDIIERLTRISPDAATGRSQTRMIH